MRFLLVALLLTVPCWGNAQTAKVYDDNGTYLGALITKGKSNVTVVTSKSYMVFINNYDGSISSLDNPGGGDYYLDSTCSGVLHAQISPGSLMTHQTSAGQTARPIYYAPRDAGAVRVAMGTTIYSGWTGCEALVINDESLWLVPVLPNDPAVTGLSTAPITPPFRFVFNGVYNDGFDPHR